MNETEKQTSKNYNYSRAIKLIKYIWNKKFSRKEWSRRKDFICIIEIWSEKIFRCGINLYANYKNFC